MRNLARLLVGTVVGLVLLQGCSSDEEAPACTIVGTYTMTAVSETQSQGCAAIPPGPASSTVTISALGDSYAIELQGVTGGCTGTPTGTCQIQTKCDVTVGDALDPTQRTGTFQFSWTFTASGFTGVNSVSLPKATSIPDGCTATARSTGTRR